MLGLSARLAALPEKLRTNEMQQKLYQSQANDAYWHGLFGGLYLPHLRRAIYTDIVALEAMLDSYAPRPACFIEDTDLDGIDEVYLQNSIIQAVLKLDSNACIFELDAYPLNHNFGDTLRRQKEHYFQKIQPSEDHSSSHDNPTNNNGIASAHDRIHFKDVIDTEDLQADNYPQGLFIDCFNNTFLNYHQESLTAEQISFKSVINSHAVHKHYMLSENKLQVLYQFENQVEGVFLY